MKLKSFFKFLVFIISITLLTSCTNEDPVTPAVSLEEEIDEIAKQNFKVGMVIGVIDKDGNKLVFKYGSKNINQNELPNENTIFDIGSLTKTFTATLVSKTYLDNNFTDDTTAHYLPERVQLPTYSGIPIRIIHLLTHTSGLPRTPHADGQTFPLSSNFEPENPYKNYTTDEVYDYLTNYCKLIFKPGEYWEYSNTGYGLLGHIVGRINNSNYEDVLTSKLFNQLGMNNSSLFLNEQQLNNYSLGYNGSLENVPYYIANDIFQGAGFIKSTLNDLFKYLEANLALTQTSLNNALDLTHEPQFDIGEMGYQALAWYVLDLVDGQTIVYSGGDTQGHSSYMGFNKKLSTGVIILSNYCMHGSQLDMGHAIMIAINKH